MGVVYYGLITHTKSRLTSNEFEFTQSLTFVLKTSCPIEQLHQLRLPDKKFWLTYRTTKGQLLVARQDEMVVPIM